MRQGATQAERPDGKISGGGVDGQRLYLVSAVLCLLLVAVFPAQASAARNKSLQAPSNLLKHKSVNFSQDFETVDPFQFWVGNGTYTVNYKGISKAKASSGHASMKFDITFGTATYVYYCIPAKIPNAGKLRFSGDIWVETAQGASASLGTNVSLAPAPTSGVNVLQRLFAPTGKWVTQSADLIDASGKTVDPLLEQYVGGATADSAGNWTDMIALFMFGSPGGHLVVYVDDLRVNGTVPDVNEYQRQRDLMWSEYKKRALSEVTEAARIVATFRPSVLDPSEEAFINQAKKKSAGMKSSAVGRGFPNGAEYRGLLSLANEVHYAKNENSVLRPDKESVVFPWEPTGPKQLLTDSYPVLAKPGNNIVVQACRGQLEAASFVLRALKPLSGVEIRISDLVGPGGAKISSEAVDIRLVKCWYQAGREVSEVNKRILVPELLLKDDELVKVDMVAQDNYVRVIKDGVSRYVRMSRTTDKLPSGAILSDSKKLLPFDLPASRNKQVWLTVKVPDDAKPGEYHGVIHVTTHDKSVEEVGYHLTVLPFDLAPPPVEYAIYYRGLLSLTPVDKISSEWKTLKQYRAEMEDMRDHGIAYPTIYQGFDRLLLPRALEVRREVGLPTDHLYGIGLWTGSPKSPAELQRLRDTDRWRALATINGFSYIYLYGIDEAQGESLCAERPAFQEVHRSGGKIFAACYEGAAKIVGDLLDLAVLNGKYNSREAAAWHANGKKVFVYGYPQVGVEDPDVYRRNYGYLLVLSGYDGVMDYAYQHGLGDVWNDFDDSHYRDHVFAYPTSDGVIDTIAWEGFREGVDDTRYLATLAASRDETPAVSTQGIVKFLGDAPEPVKIRNRAVQLLLH